MPVVAYHWVFGVISNRYPEFFRIETCVRVTPIRLRLCVLYRCVEIVGSAPVRCFCRERLPLLDLRRYQQCRFPMASVFVSSNQLVKRSPEDSDYKEVGFVFDFIMRLASVHPLSRTHWFSGRGFAYVSHCLMQGHTREGTLAGGGV